MWFYESTWSKGTVLTMYFLKKSKQWNQNEKENKLVLKTDHFQQEAYSTKTCMEHIWTTANRQKKKWGRKYGWCHNIVLNYFTAWQALPRHEKGQAMPTKFSNK